MKDSTYKDVRDSLLERRSALSDWMTEAPPEEKAIVLGPAEEPAVAAHLASLDESIAKSEAGTLGLCTVCHDYVDSSRLEVDYTASVCLDHLSPEEAIGLERELSLAQTVQRSFMPQVEPRIPGLEVAAFTRPAQFLGGDYFDFVNFASGAYGLVVGDVAGHGVSASLHMASLQALLHAIVPTLDSPREAVSQIHRLFVHNSHYPTFVTFFLAAYVASTRNLRYCNAGHNPPLLVRGEGNRRPRIEWLVPTGAAIGLVEKGEFGEGNLILTPGDVLVLYTDGVVEAADPRGDLFGIDRLEELVVSVSTSSPREVVRAVTHGLEAFVGGEALSDDTTLVVAHVT
ncbi:MAG TPA: SpoIIE family protein phosphatase [Anaerolineales bacterium]|nr:SpoIIE family protein phosphatase [Anaerolineales bacterium]